MPSSVVKKMDYCAESSTLRITYTSGRIYDYKEVPLAIFEEMKSASSKGTFLNTVIKFNYDFEEVK